MQAKWQKLIDNFDNEINVLINVPLKDISKIDVDVSKAIEGFRNKTIDIIPGGGGQYGRIIFNKKVNVTTLDCF